MKKTIFIAFIAVLTTSSCKKDRTCTCTSTGGGATSTATITIHDTKKNAKAACELPPTTNAYGSTTTCKLS